MKDPFEPALETLQILFQLENIRNGKYTFPEVQRLKESVEFYYESPTKNNFLEVKKAVKASLNYIEKWQIDFEPIKKSLDRIAQSHDLPPINWSKLLSHSKASLRFQFSALNNKPQEENLIEWLSTKSDTTFSYLNPDEQTKLLVEVKEETGFSKKLSQHLKHDPDFLFRLILNSENNFKKIASSLLVLYLTDEQLAQAITKYLPEFLEEKLSYQRVGAVIEQLNHNLSYGRSISTLLRNSNAKAILDTSICFQIYQSDDYAQSIMRGDWGTKADQEIIKPAF